MAEVVGFFGARQGIGTTVRVVSLAWELARSRQVALIDMDASGGTVTDFLRIDPEGRSIGNLSRDPEVTLGALEEQAIRVDGRAQLRVVPGVRGGCGTPAHVFLPRVAKALHEMPDALVLLDLGSPLAYPGLANISGVGQVLSTYLPRLVLFVSDDHLTLALQLASVRTARLASAQVVINTQHKTLKGEAKRVLDREAPDLVVRMEWAWSRELWTQPLHAGPQAAALGLAADGRASAQGMRWLPWARRG
ncbi:MAG: hypothetical protein ACYCZN_01975 [Candidatus Dormibacteria bacterium]